MRRFAIFLAAGLALCNPSQATQPPSTAASIKTSVDSAGDVGLSPSLALNSNGFPVIGYTEVLVPDEEYGLKVAVCHDAACRTSSLQSIAGNNFSSDISLALTSDDIPIIIDDFGPFALVLNLVVCADVLCNGYSRTIIGDLFDHGNKFSLSLNASGFPVFSYQQHTNGSRLALTACSDAICSSNPSIEVVDDSASSQGSYSSMKLDSNEFPIMSYYSFTDGHLKLARCDNTTCTSLSTPTVVDNGAMVGKFTSLDLNSNGFPVISYYDENNGDLKLATCNDAACTVRTLNSVDTTGVVGEFTSLELNGQDFPVISYYDSSREDLKIAACNDANCTNPSLTTIDGIGITGLDSSLELDMGDIPVVSYYDETNGNLRLAICNICVPSSQETVDSAGSVGQHTSLALNNGKPVISYTDTSNGSLKLAICNNESCSEKTITTVDTIGTVNAIEDTALALTNNGLAVISYYDRDDADLELAICNDAICSNPTFKTVDSLGLKGKDSSITINNNGFPVMSYYDETDFDLKLAVCNDAICSSPNISTVDGASSFVGDNTSLVLNSSGFPVISYRSFSGSSLNLAICDDATCSSSTIRIIDDDSGNVGKDTSVVLNSQGFPVISYYDLGVDDLKLAVCNDASCSQPTLVTVDETGDVGRYTNLALTIDDFPIISYTDSTNQKLKVAVCSDIACTSPTLTSMDNSGPVGDYNSMALNSRGYPVLSYYAGSPDADLKVAIFDLDGLPGIFSDGFESGNTAAWIP